MVLRARMSFARAAFFGFTLTVARALALDTPDVSTAGTPVDEPENRISDAKLPAFRMKATIPTDVHSLFDLLMDADATETWAYGISEARLIKHLGPHSDLLYLYSDTPWPVRDRDMLVVRASEAGADGQSYRITWHCGHDTQQPRRHNVVRVVSCESEFSLRRIDDNTTALEYSVSIDPAGSLPNWARNWFARKAPGQTLESIVRRATVRPRRR
jgi:hypothetical protein